MNDLCTVELLISEPTGPWSEHNNNRLILGAKRNPFENSTTSILVENHTYKTNTAIKYVPRKP